MENIICFEFANNTFQIHCLIKSLRNFPAKKNILCICNTYFLDEIDLKLGKAPKLKVQFLGI